MNRYAIAIVGGLMGVATRLLLVQPLSAFLGPTTVVWDTSACPAGIYRITAVARGGSLAPAYSVTTSDVSLPAGAIVQEFSDLPAGTYQVSATATGNNGRTFNSEVQTIQVGSDGRFVSGPGRTRPPSNPPVGFARSRNQPVEPPPPPPPTDRRLTPAAAITPAPSANAMPARANGILDAEVRFLLGWLAEDPDGMDRRWLRIDVIDEDADGAVDYVAVESTAGEVWIYRLRGSR